MIKDTEKLDFSFYKLKEGNSNVMKHIDGIMFTNIVVDNTGVNLEHGLNRIPYFVFFECLEDGYAYVVSKNRNSVVVKSNSSVGINVNILIV